MPSAFQNANALESRLLDDLDGADGYFVARAGAVCNDLPVAGKLFEGRKREPVTESPGFHVDGAFDLVGALFEGVYRAQVNDRYRLVFGQFGLQLFNRYPLDLRRLCLVGLGLRRILDAGGSDAGRRRARTDREKERANYNSPFSETHLIIS